MISVPRLRQALGNKDEATIVARRDEVVALWERETGRKWCRQVNRVQVFEPRNPRSVRLFLDLRPVASVSKVEDSPDYVTWTELTANEDWAHAHDGEVVRLGGYCWSKFIRVTYTGGYADHERDGPVIPEDIARALITQAQFMAQRLSGDKLVTKSKAFRGGSGVYEDGDYHPLFLKAVRSHRRGP